MADLAATRQALQRLTFSPVASVEITDNQGISSLADIRNLEDDDITTLIEAVRKPGGTIPNPMAGPGMPAVIPNPGIQVSMQSVKNLKLAVFYAKHRARCSHVTTLADITLQNVQAIRMIQTIEEAYDDDADETPTLKQNPNDKDIIDNLQKFETHLFKCYGVTKIPLSYVIRDDVQPPAVDPPNGYDSFQHELTARAPHGNEYYQQDNHKVYDLLKESIGSTNEFTWIKGFERTKNGREAFISYRNHVLGRSRRSNIVSKAERTLEVTKYYGEKPRFTFEKYLSIHKNAHQEIADTDPDSAISEFNKVRRMTNGIHYQPMQAAIATIDASNTLSNNFEEAADLLKSALTRSRQSGDSRNISAFGGRNGGRGGGRGGGGRGGYGRGGRGGRGYQGNNYNPNYQRGGGGRGGRGRGGNNYYRGGNRGGGHQYNKTADVKDISDRWYSNHEFYNELTEEQRKEVMRKREIRDQKRAISAIQEATAYLTNLAPAQHQEQQQQQVQQQNSTQQNSNRTNPALNRTNQRPAQH